MEQIKIRIYKWGANGHLVSKFHFLNGECWPWWATEGFCMVPTRAPAGGIGELMIGTVRDLPSQPLGMQANSSNWHLQYWRHPEVVSLICFPSCCHSFFFFQEIYYSWFTLFCQFLLYSKVGSHTSRHTLFLILSFIMFHHKWLDIVPYAIQQTLTANSLLV